MKLLNYLMGYINQNLIQCNSDLYAYEIFLVLYEDN